MVAKYVMFINISFQTHDPSFYIPKSHPTYAMIIYVRYIHEKNPKAV